MLENKICVSQSIVFSSVYLALVLSQLVGHAAYSYCIVPSSQCARVANMYADAGYQVKLFKLKNRIRNLNRREFKSFVAFLSCDTHMHKIGELTASVTLSLPATQNDLCIYVFIDIETKMSKGWINK